jgi:hypothetical protein
VSELLKEMREEKQKEIEEAREEEAKKIEEETKVEEVKEEPKAEEVKEEPKVEEVKEEPAKEPTLEDQLTEEYDKIKENVELRKLATEQADREALDAEIEQSNERVAKLTAEIKNRDKEVEAAEKPKQPEMEDGTRFSPKEIEKEAVEKMSPEEYGDATIKSREKIDQDDLGITTYKYTTPEGQEYIIKRGYDSNKDAPANRWDVYKGGEVLDDMYLDSYPTRSSAESVLKEGVGEARQKTKEPVNERAEQAEKKAEKKVEPEEDSPTESLLAAKTTSFTTFMDAPRKRGKLEIMRDDVVSLLEGYRDAEMKAAKTEAEQKTIFNRYEDKIRKAKNSFSRDRAVKDKRALEIRRKMLEDFIRDNRQDIMKLHGNVVPAVMNRINKIKTITSLNKAMDYIEEVFGKELKKEERRQKTKLRKSIDELTDPSGKKYINAKEGIKQLKDKSVSMRDWVKRLETIRQNMLEMTKEEAGKEMQKILDKEELSIEDYERLEELSLADMASMDLAELSRAEGKLKELLGEVRSKSIQDRIAQRAIIQEKRDKTQNELTGGKEVLDDPHQERTLDIKNRLSLLDFVGNSSWFSLLDKLSKHEMLESKGKVGTYNSRMVREWGDPVHKADVEHNTGMRETLGTVQDAFNRIMGKEVKAKSDYLRKKKLAVVAARNKGHETFENGKKVDNLVRDEYTDITGKKKPFVHSKNEIINMWMQMQRPGMEATMEGMGIFRQREDGTYEMTDLGKTIERNMTPEMKEWAEFQRDLYDKVLYDRYAPVYEEMFGVPMPKNDRYVPTYRETEVGDQTNITDLLSRETFQNIGHNRHLYKVTGSKAKLKIMDADEVLLTYIQRMEHFRAKAGLIKELNQVWRDRTIQRALEQNFGREYNDVVNNFLEDFAGRNIDYGRFARKVDWVRKNFTVASLAVKPVVFMKQLMSLPAYSAFMPAGELSKGMVKFMTNPEKYWKLMNEIPFVKNRYNIGSFDRDLAAAMKQRANQMTAGSQNIASDLMFLVKWGDRVPIMLGGFATYDYYKRKSLKEGKSAAKAHEIGVMEAERATRFTQQAANIADLSAWQRGGPWAKLFTMYMTAPLSYHRLASGGLRRMYYGAKAGSPQTVMEGAKAAAIGHVILPVLFQAAANGFSFDSKEERRDLMWAGILGNINSLFLIGEAAQWLVDSAVRGKGFEYQMSPLGSIAKDSGKALAKAIDNLEDYAGGDDVSFEEIQEIVDAILTPLTSIYGVAYKGPASIYSGIEDVIKGDTEYPLRRIMGFSESGLDRADIDYSREKPKGRNSRSRKNNNRGR